jgi:hypothetical protein
MLSARLSDTIYLSIDTPINRPIPNVTAWAINPKTTMRTGVPNQDAGTKALEN